MKKIFSFFVVVLLCFMTTTVSAGTVTKEDAATLAGTFLTAKTQTASPNRAPSSGAANSKTINFKALDLSKSVESDYLHFLQNT